MRLPFGWVAGVGYLFRSNCTWRRNSTVTPHNPRVECSRDFGAPSTARMGCELETDTEIPDVYRVSRLAIIARWPTASSRNSCSIKERRASVAALGVA